MPDFKDWRWSAARLVVLLATWAFTFYLTVAALTTGIRALIFWRYAETYQRHIFVVTDALDDGYWIRGYLIPASAPSLEIDTAGGGTPWWTPGRVMADGSVVFDQAPSVRVAVGTTIDVWWSPTAPDFVFEGQSSRFAVAAEQPHLPGAISAIGWLSLAAAGAAAFVVNMAVLGKYYGRKRARSRQARPHR